MSTIEHKVPEADQQYPFISSWLHVPSAVSMASLALVSFGVGGWFGLGFGRISMPIIVTTTNAANVTARNEWDSH